MLRNRTAEVHEKGRGAAMGEEAQFFLLRTVIYTMIVNVARIVHY